MASWFVEKPDKGALCTWLADEAAALRTQAAATGLKDGHYTLVVFYAPEQESGVTRVRVLRVKRKSRFRRTDRLDEMVEDATRKVAREHGVRILFDSWTYSTTEPWRVYGGPIEFDAAVMYSPGFEKDGRPVFSVYASDLLWQRIWPEMFSAIVGPEKPAPKAREPEYWSSSYLYHERLTHHTYLASFPRSW